MRLSRLSDIIELYATRGEGQYGEDVTQMEHAVQSAALAEAHGGPPSLIAASLLHDIGHLFEPDEAMPGLDHAHERIGAKALNTLFGDSVCQPVALHVAAKKYLCFKDRGYFQGLSPASKHSLALQGGVFSRQEAASFERLPYWRDAVALRRFDDTGKRAEFSRRAFAEFTPLLRQLLIGEAKA